jgi:hypothetical protein
VRLGEERKQFFFEKKNQKTFVYKAFALPQRVRQMDKSFCFFFKKKCFLAVDGSAALSTEMQLMVAPPASVS